jgi:hypothetical protein
MAASVDDPLDDAYGLSASISRTSMEADNFYRSCVLDLTMRLAQNTMSTRLNWRIIPLIMGFPIPRSTCAVLEC